MSIDLPEQYESACYEDISQALEDAQVLAARVAIMRSEAAEYGDIYKATYDDVMRVMDVLKMYEDDAVYSYTGEGFVPIINATSRSMFTAYSYITNRGKFSSFALLDPDDFDFLSSDDLDEDDDDGDISLFDDDRSLSVEISNLRTPKRGYGFFIEFIVNRALDEDQMVGGIAARSNDTAYYNIMDLERLRIDYVELNSKESYVDEEQIVPIMLQEAQKMTIVKRDATFRRGTKKQQMQSIDQTLAQLNKSLGLERIRFAINAPTYLMSTSKAGRREIYTYNDKEPHDTEILVEPIRIDCLDSYDLPLGKRIVNDASLVYPDAGLYLVGVLHDYQVHLLNMPSDIVWIPLGDKSPDDFILLPRDEDV